MHRDSNALPRAFLVPSAQSVAPGQAMAAMSAPSFDPHREVVLEGASDQPSAGTFVPARIQTLRPELVELSVDAPAREWLVMMDSVYPGWHATIDGAPAQIHPANWVGRGVAVPVGQHTVRFEFQPASVRVGLFFSLAALLGVLATAVVARKTSVRSRRCA